VRRSRDALTSSRSRTLLPTLLVNFMLCGCVPYPVYKTLQPAAQVTVLDEASVPIEGAHVELITDFKPHSAPTREVKATDRNGFAAFDLRREWQTESMIMHGIRFHDWNWCVRKPAFMTYVRGGRSGDEFAERATIPLRRGASTECPRLS
jgi:hypothetical protein